MRINVPVFTLLIVAGLTAAACEEGLSKLAGPTPNPKPTFSSIQREIFEKRDSAGRSACITCHITGGIAAFSRLILTSDVIYDNLVNVPSRFRPGTICVATGDPDTAI